MSNKAIIYPQPNGSVAVMRPVLQSGLTVEQIAVKDVPAGTPFKIVDAAIIPQDQTFFDAWEADFSQVDGVGGPKQ